jgi:hypothetical protein
LTPRARKPIFFTENPVPHDLECNGGKVKRILAIVLFAIACPLLAPGAGRADHAFSVGYGLAFLNIHKQTGRIEGGRYHDFFQATYLYERPCRDYRQLAVFIEPFAAYVSRPNEGVDVGLYVGLKWYPMDHLAKGLFVLGGTGAAYTTTKFKEQGTHGVFTLEVGVGYRFERFYVQDMLRHYSNGATSHPNRSVQDNILSVGMYF